MELVSMGSLALGFVFLGLGGGKRRKLRLLGFVFLGVAAVTAVVAVA
jgi:hypothetical protein